MYTYNDIAQVQTLTTMVERKWSNFKIVLLVSYALRRPWYRFTYPLTQHYQTA